MRSTCNESFHSTDRTNSRLVPVKALRSEHDGSRDHALDELDTKLIGESEPMQSLKRSIRIVARSAETVLITGESGTGKELVAGAIHDLSTRRSKPFLPINCGALTESLLESELFGHVKGSFTGAITNKKGYFEAASEGTIFLDEFAEMSLAMQQRLLRVLQEGTVRPVGSTDPKETQIDCRVLVATNHDLKRDVSEGKFRNDLYYRVNVLEIRAPALRHRPEDILLLVPHFIRRYNEKNARHISEQLTPSVLSILGNYSWPGNVRELENITKRLALRAGELGTITEAEVRTVPELNQLANHEEGKHKARLFAAALGITADDVQDLRRALLEMIRTQDAQLGLRDEYGQRYTVDFLFEWGGKQAMIRSGWIIEHDSDTPRLTTCYPL